MGVVSIQSKTWIRVEFHNNPSERRGLGRNWPLSLNWNTSIEGAQYCAARLGPGNKVIVYIASGSVLERLAEQTEEGGRKEFQLGGTVKYLDAELCVCIGKDEKSILFYNPDTMDMIKYIYVGHRMVELVFFDKRTIVAIVEVPNECDQIVLITPNYDELIERFSASL